MGENEDLIANTDKREGISEITSEVTKEISKLLHSVMESNRNILPRVLMKKTINS